MAEAITGNFTQVEVALAALIPRVAAANEFVERAGAEIIATLAAQNAPRLTGHLAASTDDEGGLVVANTPYAIFQEYGTRRHKAQPFMRPAIERGSLPFRQAAERIYTVATR